MEVLNFSILRNRRLFQITSARVYARWDFISRFALIGVYREKIPTIPDHMFRLVHGFKGMYYLRKVVSACEQCSPVSTCLCPKYITFRFQIWKMVEKLKNDVLELKNGLILANYIGKFIFIVKTKSSLPTFVFIFSTVSQILKTKFYVFQNM